MRDDWGIAHVHGKTDADAVFGLIYAEAEDDFNRVETNFLLSQGRLAEAEGTVWSGAGKLEFLDARGRTGAAKPVAWRLRPVTLLRGRAELEFFAGDAPFTVVAFPTHIEASDVRLALPASDDITVTTLSVGAKPRCTW